MKHALKRILQSLLGFENYLVIFSLFKIRTLKWDSNENQIFHFLKLVKDDGYILDIGANIGIMTSIIASSRPRSTVAAFEPMPQNLKALRSVIAKKNHSNVEIHECALGSEAGNLEMIMPEVKNVKLQGLSHVADDDTEEGTRLNVPVKRLDDLNFDRPISGIKIDVENYEYEVLRGAEKILSSSKPVVYCELWDNEKRDKTVEYMSGLGYKLHLLSANKLSEAPSRLPSGSNNYFFLPS